MHRYRRLLADVPGVIVPYRDADVERSACYVMPVLLEDAARASGARAHARRRTGCRPACSIPRLHELQRLRRGRAPAAARAPRTSPRAQLTLPLYPHLDEARQDLVVEALRSALNP